MKRTPQFLRTADQLDKWLERFNPLRGATLASLGGYFDEADEGRYTNAAWFARKMIRRDETIRACMRRIYSTIMKLDWSVKIMDVLPAGVTEAAAKRQAEALRRRYEQIQNLKAAVAFSAMADFWGFAHLEKHYDADGNVARLEPVPQWHWLRDGLYGPWRYNPSARPWAKDAVAIDPAHFVVREVDDPWMEIALIHGLRKNQNDRDWDGFCARYGIPNTFFVSPQGATEDDQADYRAMAEELAADGTGVLPHGAEVKTHESSQKGEVFSAKGRRHDSAIVLAATGGLLTMLAESGSGTLAGGAHQDTWKELVSGIAAEVAEVFQDQMDKTWLAEWFPNQPVAAYFSLAFPDEPVDRKALAESLAGFKTAGFVAPVEWVAETSGIPFAAPEPSTPPPLKNRQPGAANDPAFMRLVLALNDDLKPVQEVLEGLLNATDAELQDYLERAAARLPDLADDVFAGDQAEQVLRDLAAVELMRGAL